MTKHPSVHVATATAVAAATVWLAITWGMVLLYADDLSLSGQKVALVRALDHVAIWVGSLLVAAALVGVRGWLLRSIERFGLAAALVNLITDTIYLAGSMVLLLYFNPIGALQAGQYGPILVAFIVVWVYCALVTILNALLRDFIYRRQGGADHE